MLDSHCHLADDDLFADREGIAARARDAGVETVLCILDAVSDDECSRAVPLVSCWDRVAFAVGVHPHQSGRFAEDMSAAANQLEARLARLERIQAVGEIGLDYHYAFAPPGVQQEVFALQLQVALAHRLPVVIHCREAESDTLHLLDREGRGVRAVFHCFTGDVALARRVLDRGCWISLSGIVTFPKAAALREVARFVPADRLLVETDSPFLAPVPHRGRRNEPAWVAHVAACVAAERRQAIQAFDEQLHASFAAFTSA